MRSLFRTRLGLLRLAIVFAFALVFYLISSHLRPIFNPTPVNNHVVLADAWLHGRVWIGTSQPYWVDCVMYMGKCYVIEGPMPAVLLLPLVLIFGLSTNQSLVCVVIAAAGVAAFDLLIGRMKIGDPLRLLLVGLFGFGTVFWWCAVNPNVWMFAHVVCTTFLVFGLAEWYGKRRAWLVGFWFACAALTRSPAILAVPPFLVWAWIEGGGRSARSFVTGFLPLMLLDVVYNYARWHTPFDIGYTLWYHQDTAGSPTGYPLALRYLPYNLYSYFFLAPQFSVTPPWIVLSYQGVALTFTSPALALSLSAQQSRETLFLWITAALVSLPGLLYYVNGYAQFGMRHTLDFTPFLLCLVARGFVRRVDALAYALIAFSVIANAFGVWAYRT